MKSSARKHEESTDKNEREAYAKAVGARIRNLRLNMQWTQEMLAQKAEINDKYVYDIEAGKKCMSIWVLNKLSKALQVDASELLRG